MHSMEEINQKLDAIWEVMNNCIENGLLKQGFLPGPLKVRRRAFTLYERTR